MDISEESVRVTGPGDSTFPSAKCHWCSLGFDTSLHVFSFLGIQELIYFSACSNATLQQARNNCCWESLLEQHLGVTDINEKPPQAYSLTNPSSRIIQPPGTHDHNAFYAFVAWRTEFAGYSNADVKRVKTWWTRIEKFLAQHSPEILATLGPPLSEAQIHHLLAKDRACSEFMIPQSLKLVYRFHDGQRLPGQQRLLHKSDEQSQRFQSQQELLELGYGLLGGVTYYDQLTNCYLLPLECVVTLNCNSCHYRDRQDYACSVQSLFQGSDEQGRETALDSGLGLGLASSHLWERQSFGRNSSDFVMFACSTLMPGEGIRGGPRKGFFVNKRSPSGVSGIFTNCKGCKPVDDDLILTSCIAPSIMQQLRRDAFGPYNGFLSWLEEYAHRLECGVYGVEPLKMYGTTREAQAAQGKRDRNIHMISLFARPSALGGSGTAGVVVTKGIEVTASPYLVTNESHVGVSDANTVGWQPMDTTESSRSYFWTYSIRLRLLRDHPSRPANLHSAQLVSRHWRISDANTPAEQQVDGPGVVGEFPLLQTAEPGTEEFHPFAYQSCTEHRTRGKFGGRVKFRCERGALQSYAATTGYLRDTRGHVLVSDDLFEAELPTMNLDINLPQWTFLY